MANQSIKDDLLIIQKGLNEQVLQLIVAHRKRHYDRLTQLSGSISRKLNKTVRDDVEFSEILELLGELSDEVLASISQSTEANFIDEFHETVGVIQQEIPSRISYNQDENCFSSVNSDGFYVKLGKVLKRSNRELKRTYHSFSSSIRRLIGKEIVQREVEKHEVRWIRVSRSISVELLEQLSVLRNEDHSYFSKIASILDDICDHGLNNIRREQDIRILEDLHASLNRRKSNIENEVDGIIHSIVQELVPQITFMGTFQESSYHFSSKSLEKREKNAIQLIHDAETKWQKNCEIHLSQLSIDVGIHQFNALITRELSSFKDAFNTTLNKKIIPILVDTESFLRKTADAIEATSLKSVRTGAFKKYLIETQNELNLTLNESFSNPIVSVLKQTDLNNDMEAALSRILLGDEVLPDRALVFDSKPDKNELAITDHETLNFRSELTTYLKNDVFRKLRKIPVGLVIDLEKFHGDVDEVIQVSMVNLQLAIELLEADDKSEDDGKILSLIHDGLDRAAKRTNEIQDKAEKLIKRANTELDTAYEKYQEVSKNAMVDDNYLYIRSKNREAMVISRALDWKTRLNSKWLLFLDRLTVRYRFTIQLAKKLYQNLQRILGYRNSEDTEGYIQAGAAEFLAQTEQKLSELPLIYRRLFAEDALQEPRFFKGRESTKLTLTESYEIWSRGHFSNFVMVGEKGSGKTSCMLILPESVGIKHPIQRGVMLNSIWTESQLIEQLSEIVGIPKQSNKEDFIQKVNVLKERKVIILEGFQNLFLRSINGFEALEAFLLILSQTAGKLYWMLTSSRYGWMYLNKIYQVSGYFSHVRIIDNLNSETIEDIILARHKVSGYDLNFIPSEDMITSRSFKKLETKPEEQQRLVRKTFFKALSEISEGNISIAMQYWLRSIRNTGVDVIEISPFSDVNITLGDAFTNEDYFALAAIVQHDDLTVFELSIVLNTTEQKARLILSKLSSRAIILKRSDRYFLNQLLYRHIINVLKMKNILH